MKFKGWGDNDVRLIIQKNIIDTNVNPSQNRVSLPNNQLREEAKDSLTEFEKKTLDGRYANIGIVNRVSLARTKS